MNKHSIIAHFSGLCEYDVYQTLTSHQKYLGQDRYKIFLICQNIFIIIYSRRINEVLIAVLSATRYKDVMY